MIFVALAIGLLTGPVPGASAQSAADDRTAIRQWQNTAAQAEAMLDLPLLATLGVGIVSAGMAVIFARWLANSLVAPAFPAAQLIRLPEDKVPQTVWLASALGLCVAIDGFLGDVDILPVTPPALTALAGFAVVVAAAVLLWRNAVNGLRYIVKTGAPWRWMPHDLPAWAAVYQQTRRWRAAGQAAGRHERARVVCDPPRMGVSVKTRKVRQRASEG
ncbi:hypothetical protein A8V01_26680 [Novosphingobium guangzhouense]|uniref:Insertion element IS402-like domain-containing protein n=1 Tax=Novosphingobium guangzhouense TaxID=1850347 RepID=A0A2K2FU44_9SPHN|nr:hypothetical protein A8V01_26680 [Novosphingobium guangzhouense]